MILPGSNDTTVDTGDDSVSDELRRRKRHKRRNRNQVGFKDDHALIKKRRKGKAFFESRALYILVFPPADEGGRHGVAQGRVSTWEGSRSIRLGIKCLKPLPKPLVSFMFGLF